MMRAAWDIRRAASIAAVFVATRRTARIWTQRTKSAQRNEKTRLRLIGWRMTLSGLRLVAEHTTERDSMINPEKADYTEAAMYESILRMCIHFDREKVMECMRDRLASLIACGSHSPQHLALIDAYMALVTLAGTEED
jgi:hypothetical protein